MEDERKQIPFRYSPEELDKDFEEIMKIQGWSPKKNKAIKHAIIIAAAYIKKNKKKFNPKKDSYASLEDKINTDLKGFLSKDLQSWGK